MRKDLDEKLKVTPCTQFTECILNAINQYEEKYRNPLSMTEQDRLAIHVIRSYLILGIEDGVIIRQDLKVILKTIYWYIGRFWSDFPLLIEAIRQKPEFCTKALARGNAQTQVKDKRAIQLSQELVEERKQNQQLILENQQLAKEYKVTNEELLTVLEEKENYRHQLIAEQSINSDLQRSNELLCNFILEKGLSLPTELTINSAMQIPSRPGTPSWAWSSPENSRCSTPSLFKRESRAISSVSQGGSMSLSSKLSASPLF